jgi:hypothetical protein
VCTILWNCIGVREIFLGWYFISKKALVMQKIT